MNSTAPWLSVGQRAAPADARLLGFGGATFWLACLVVLLASTLGGGTQSGLGADAAIQLVSIALIASVLLEQQNVSRPRYRAGVAIAIAALAWPALQLVPMPPSLWTLIPGRSYATQVYDAAGIGLPWLPVSLDPDATLRAGLSLFPAIAVFLGISALSRQARRTVTLVFLAVGVLAMMLGLAQLMQGPGSALRFFPVTNESDSVGFFANRNHHAAFLYSLIPFVAAWAAGMWFDRRSDRRLASLIVFLVIYVLVIVGIVMTRSRGGAILAIALSAASLLIVRAVSKRSGGRATIAIALAFALAVVVGAALGYAKLLPRFDGGVVDSFRGTMAETTIPRRSPVSTVRRRVRHVRARLSMV